MQDKSKKPAKVGSVEKSTNDVVTKITDQVEKVENILVALSNNPTVDELAAALGLTMFLDSLGKHATAIFSGKIPNALEFLNPEETFEVNTNSLQDFIIALNKDKADHLRYKLDGDYVKVFITPYKTTLSEEDLEFSHGDFNVNLVIALNVPTVDDLDGALFEHGRIMHDASSINITTGVAGKFGEIEWSDPAASSVSEMAVRLVNAMRDRSQPMPKDIATAFLTGIVAATERFSNDRTTPATMTMASRLMEAGADQTVIAENVMKVGAKSTPGVIDATEAVAKGESADLGTMELSHEEKKDGQRAPGVKDGSLLRLTKDKKDGIAVDKDEDIFSNMAKSGKNPADVPRKTLTPPTLVKNPQKPASTPNPVKTAPVRSPEAQGGVSGNLPQVSGGDGANRAGGANGGGVPRAEATPELPADSALENLKKDINAAVSAGKNPAAMMAPEVAEPVGPVNVPTLNFPQNGEVEAAEEPVTPGVGVSGAATNAGQTAGDASGAGQTAGATTGATAQTAGGATTQAAGSAGENTGSGATTGLPNLPLPPTDFNVGAVNYEAGVSPSLPPVQMGGAAGKPTETTLTLDKAPAPPDPGAFKIPGV